MFRLETSACFKLIRAELTLCTGNNKQKQPTHAKYTVTVVNKTVKVENSLGNNTDPTTATKETTYSGNRVCIVQEVSREVCAVVEHRREQTTRNFSGRFKKKS